jgi:hypothetical protein
MKLRENDLLCLFFLEFKDLNKNDNNRGKIRGLRISKT